MGPALGGWLWSIGVEQGFLLLNWIAMTALTGVTMVLLARMPRRLECSYQRGADAAAAAVRST